MPTVRNPFHGTRRRVPTGGAPRPEVVCRDDSLRERATTGDDSRAPTTTDGVVQSSSLKEDLGSQEGRGRRRQVEPPGWETTILEGTSLPPTSLGP